jgi:hypothetical protein
MFCPDEELECIQDENTLNVKMQVTGFFTLCIITLYKNLLWNALNDTKMKVSIFASVDG